MSQNMGSDVKEIISIPSALSLAHICENIIYHTDQKMSSDT